MGQRLDRFLSANLRRRLVLSEQVWDNHQQVVLLPRAPTQHQFAGVRLLLVEDNEINREFAGELLRSEDILVDEAKDGAEAVAMVQEHEYDVVLMDIQMPVMDGLEATRQIRALAQIPGNERYSVLPILAMTALAMTHDAERSEQAGMNDHVTKPVEPEKLLSALAKWVSVPGRHAPKRAAAQPVIPPELRALRHLAVERGLHRIGDNVQAYRRQLQRFREHYSGAIAEIRRLLNESSVYEAEQYCHALKGVAGNIGAQELFEKVSMVDDLLETGRIPQSDEIDEMALCLNDVINEISTVEGVAPSPAPQAGSTLMELDDERLSALLLELRQALQYDLGAAEPLLQELRHGCHGGPWEGAADEIAKLADIFDVDGAVDRIGRLQKELQALAVS